MACLNAYSDYLPIGSYRNCTHNNATGRNTMTLSTHVIIVVTSLLNTLNDEQCGPSVMQYPYPSKSNLRFFQSYNLFPFILIWYLVWLQLYPASTSSFLILTTTLFSQSGHRCGGGGVPAISGGALLRPAGMLHHRLGHPQRERTRSAAGKEDHLVLLWEGSTIVQSWDRKRFFERQNIHPIME